MKKKMENINLEIKIEEKNMAEKGLSEEKIEEDSKPIDANFSEIDYSNKRASAESVTYDFNANNQNFLINLNNPKIEEQDQINIEPNKEEQNFKFALEKVDTQNDKILELLYKNKDNMNKREFKEKNDRSEKSEKNSTGARDIYNYTEDHRFSYYSVTSKQDGHSDRYQSDYHQSEYQESFNSRKMNEREIEDKQMEEPGKEIEEPVNKQMDQIGFLKNLEQNSRNSENVVVKYGKINHLEQIN
jgi:hypothetical protein